MKKSRCEMSVDIVTNVNVEIEWPGYLYLKIPMGSVKQCVLCILFVKC